MLAILPCKASLEDLAFNTKIAGEKVIFTYHIPDEDENNQKERELIEEETSQDIVSDDITADTSGLEYYDANDDTYELDDMYSDVLYGYAEYFEDGDTIFLEDINPQIAQLNIQNPLTFEGKNYSSLKTTPKLYNNKQFSKYNVPEFDISTVYQQHQKNFGKGFSAGTTYWQGISDGELEQSSGLFSRFEYKRVALTTTYSKTVNSTNNDYSDNILLTPELSINQYLTLKEILSTNILNRTRKAEHMVSFNPFGKKDYDRLRLNLSVVQTFDEANNLLKNQFKFYTNYKF